MEHKKCENCKEEKNGRNYWFRFKYFLCNDCAKIPYKDLSLVRKLVLNVKEKRFNKKTTECTMFGGADALGYNALMTALCIAAAEQNQTIYDYIEKTPKTSFVVELYDALLSKGYKIVEDKGGVIRHYGLNTIEKESLFNSNIDTSV